MSSKKFKLGSSKVHTVSRKFQQQDVVFVIFSNYLFIFAFSLKKCELLSRKSNKDDIKGV